MRTGGDDRRWGISLLRLLTQLLPLYLQQLGRKNPQGVGQGEKTSRRTKEAGLVSDDIKGYCFPL